MTINVLFLVRQEQELRNGGTVDKKLSTLADLFRPPIELMHKGSFETVRSHSADTLHLPSLFCLWTFSEISDGDHVDLRWDTRCVEHAGCHVFLKWACALFQMETCITNITCNGMT